MLKLIVITLFLGLSLSYSSAQKKTTDFDKYFPKTSFDTLHIHVNLNHQDYRISIPDDFTKKPLKQEFYPISSFHFDEKKEFKAYLLLSAEKKPSWKNHVYLIVFNQTKNNVILSTEIASYEYLEGAYQKWQNAWIADFNGDGSLDIGIYKKLIDFELPTAESENISGSEKYLLVFTNGEFKYQTWNFNVLKKYKLLPQRNQLNTSMQTKQITVEGTALNAKLGAIIKTEKGEVFYLEGIYEWPDHALDKIVKAIGYISSEYYDPKNLVTKDGLHKTGMSGEKLTLQKVKWEIIEK